LKPFSDQRFEATMSRVRARAADIDVRDFAERDFRMISPSHLAGPKLDRFVLKVSGMTRFLDVGDVEWIEGAGVYVTLHTSNRPILHRSSLTDLEARLDERHFIRIHRSAIVNIERVSH